MVIIGIRRRGVPLAERICRIIEESEGSTVPFGIVTSPYTDDLTLLAEHPVIHKTQIPFSIQGKKVILLMMFCTPRTVRRLWALLM